MHAGGNQHGAGVGVSGSSLGKGYPLSWPKATSCATQDRHTQPKEALMFAILPLALVGQVCSNLTTLNLRAVR